MAFDEIEGTARLTLPAADAFGVHATFLHVEGIETGLGANDVGLDRGAMSGARLVRFRSVGGRVLLEQLGTGFRAEDGSEAEKAAAAQSFATSVLFAAEPMVAAGGGVSIDVTDFLVRDAHGIAATLKGSGQGSYKLDRDRSALDVDRCRAFPDNLDFSAVLTFTSSEPGRLARQTAPDGRALTFVQRQGFVRLPDAEYERRPYDPRMGALSISYLDYSADLDEPITRRFAVRHRLRRDAVTGAYLPIVYYVDGAAPEPVRSALVQGASWWSDAFAAAGYPDLFRVEVAPEGLDPLDVRHNVIQWVHRSTRGWSYGNAISDPRTGEIIKGHVSLGSLRVRQDRLLFEGLLGTVKTGTGAADDPVELSLARIRQLAAHEVGHTLGLSHNFAASTNDRASVMDYPAPRVRPDGSGGLDVSDVYGVGIGAWDKHAIRMLYEEPTGDATVGELYAGLQAASERRGLIYLTDQDARSAGAAQPLANLWDDGPEPLQGLRNAMEVRRIALDAFRRDRLAEGRALSELEEVFVPVYLHHRYQVDAAVKMVGGLNYTHEINRRGVLGARPVDPAYQQRALDALMETLSPSALAVPPILERLLLPRPPGYGTSRETFARRTSPGFDVLGAADVAARVTVRGLLHPDRLLRVVRQGQQAEQSGVEGMLSVRSILDAMFDVARAAEGNPLGTVVTNVVVEEALATYRSGRTTRAVREEIWGWLQAETGAERDSLLARTPDLRGDVMRVLRRSGAPDEGSPAAGAPKVPPGSPIGSLHLYGCSCDR